MKSDGSTKKHKDPRLEIAFGSAALLSILLGLSLYIGADTLGIEPATSQRITIAFIVAGSIDALVMLFWEYTFGSNK